uniref:Uncharacterized protein n=1 Tax=Arundo donax TaxID=35708 RepID=A0A0A9G2T2_ARUDO
MQLAEPNREKQIKIEMLPVCNIARKKRIAILVNNDKKRDICFVSMPSNCRY